MNQSDEEKAEQAYHAGRFQLGHPDSHFEDYQRGRFDRQRWEDATTPAAAKRPSAAAQDVGGGLGILLILGILLVLAIAVAVVAATAAVASLIAATIIWGTARKLSRGNAPTYLATYKVSFIGLVLYLVILWIWSGAITAGVDASAATTGSLNPGAGVLDTASTLRKAALNRAFPPPPDPWARYRVTPAPAQNQNFFTVTAALLLFHGPGVLVYAFVISRWLRGPFAGVRGFLTATLVSAIALAIAVSITFVGWGLITGSSDSKKSGQVAKKSDVNQHLSPSVPPVATSKPVTEGPPMSRGASQTKPTVATRSQESEATQNVGGLNGVWYSPQHGYGFRIEGKVGIATASNSQKYKPGDRILELESVSEKSFRGQQMFRSGRWVAVSGELVDPRTIRMQGGGFTWTMSRR